MTTDSQAFRQHYGIAEIAAALGVDRQLVTVWRKRGSWGMPEPDDKLAAGPLWLASTIDPWISVTRARLEEDGSYRGGQKSGLSAQALRRYLRLTVTLLEEPLRPGLAAKAARELGELVPALEQAVVRDPATARRLEGLLELARRAGNAVEGVASSDEATCVELLRDCVSLFRKLTPLAEYCLETRVSSPLTER